LESSQTGTKGNNVVRGRVKWFNDAKGYGFITIDDQDQDVFVHYSKIAGEGHKTLAQGQEVEMEVEQGQRGLQAVNVVKI
jgi:CspA family cold shock protein